MKYLRIALLILLYPFLAFSQETGSNVPVFHRPNNPMFLGTGLNDLQPAGNLSEQKRMDIGVQLGTSFSTNFNRGYSFTTFARPELRYRINNRFRIRGGISIANSEYGNTLVYAPYGYTRYSGNITQGMLYVSGDYMISPKVMLTGTAYKEFSIDHGSPDERFKPAYDGKGLMMNLRITPSENVFIDVGAEFYQGNNPFRSGMYPPYRHNPFIW